MTKRLFDLFASVILFIILGLALVTLAFLIRSRLGSPVLFRQTRPGLHGKPFQMIKFRTMRDAIGPDGQPLPDSERMTPFGSFLRAASLDELPELWNVLKGEMSLVGPRPLLMEYLPLYSPEQARRHEVRPGVTGWAQINGRNALSWEEKFRLDVWYVDNRSFWLDLKILALTVKKVFVREGISAAGEVTAAKFTGSPKGTLYAVYGASGCGRGIMPLAREQLRQQGVALDRLVFIDDGAVEANTNGQQVLSYADFLAEPASERRAVLAIANSTVRERLALRCAADDVRPWNVAAENVVVMDNVVIGEGAALSPFVTITSNIRIGSHFHANLYGYVEHDCVIGDFVTFAPGVKCNGNVVIEDHAYIGAGAVIKQGKPGAPLVIGRGAVVGMGAVVTKSVPAGATVVGNPARIMNKD